MSTDDLRGSAPVLTAKDVLLEVRQDVREMKTGLDVLLSQNLNERVTLLEAGGSVAAQRALALAEAHEIRLQQMAGMTIAVKAIFGVSLLGVAVSIVGLLVALGVIK